jgi:hypothetical protein
MVTCPSVVPPTMQHLTHDTGRVTFKPVIPDAGVHNIWTNAMETNQNENGCGNHQNPDQHQIGGEFP